MKSVIHGVLDLATSKTFCREKTSFISSFLMTLKDLSMSQSDVEDLRLMLLLWLTSSRAAVSRILGIRFIPRLIINDPPLMLHLFGDMIFNLLSGWWQRQRRGGDVEQFPARKGSLSSHYASKFQYEHKQMKLASISWAILADNVITMVKLDHLL